MGSSVERIECCVRSRGLSTGEVARRGVAAERGPRRARRGGTSVAFRDRLIQVPSSGGTGMKLLQLALGLSVLVAASGAAQSRGLREVRSWGFGGGGVMVGIPVGEFRNFVDVAGGFGGVIAVNLDRRGSVGLRLTGSYLQYGHERRPVALAGTGGLLGLGLHTAFYIAPLRAGPHFVFGAGPVRLYGFGTAGVPYLATEPSPGRSGSVFRCYPTHV